LGSSGRVKIEGGWETWKTRLDSVMKILSWWKGSAHKFGA